MMQPIMFDYILKGATKGELVAIQRILDRNKELCIPNEFCENGGKVFSSEYFEVPDKGDYFVFDLSKEGIIRLKCDSRVGIIYYDIPDRDRVLEQLVLMISGYKILDCDYSEIIDILKKGCVFKWVQFGGSYDKAIYNINMALKSVKNKVVASYFQINDLALAEAAEIISEVIEEYHVETYQFISSELEEIEGTVSMFISVGEDPFLLAKCRKGL